MFRRIRSWFAWKDDRNSGVWLYQRNSVTGERRAIKISRCYQPLNLEWLTADVLPAKALFPHGPEYFVERWTMPAPPTSVARPMR